MTSLHYEQAVSTNLQYIRLLRTGASLFFNLDVTQLRSADATRGLKRASQPNVSLTCSPTKGNIIEKNTDGTRGIHGQEQPGSISEYNWSIYHFLCCAFGQCVSILEIVDLNVFDIIAVCDIHITIDVACARPRGSCW